MQRRNLLTGLAASALLPRLAHAGAAAGGTQPGQPGAGAPQPGNSIQGPLAPQDASPVLRETYRQFQTMRQTRYQHRDIEDVRAGSNSEHHNPQGHGGTNGHAVIAAGPLLRLANGSFALAIFDSTGGFHGPFDTRHTN